MNNTDGSKVTPRKKSIKKIIMILLFIILNIVIIGYTALEEFTKERPENIEIEFGFINVLFLVGGFVCLGVVLLMETLKYLMMMRSLGEKVSLKHAFQVGALGKYYDSITPSGAGGQPFQIWYLHSNKYSPGASAAMSLSGFLTMQLGFIFLAIVIFIFNKTAIESTAVRISAYFGLLFYIIVPAFIILFAIAPKFTVKIIMFFVRLCAKLRFIKSPYKTGKKIMTSLKEYRDSLVTIAKEKFLLVKLMVLSIIYQIALCSIPYFVLKAFSGDIPYITVLCMTVFIYSAITYIPTPGNTGAAEGSFYLIFSSLGANSLFWAMLVWRFICYYMFIIIGVFIYGYNALTRKKTIAEKE